MVDIQIDSMVTITGAEYVRLNVATIELAKSNARMRAALISITELDGEINPMNYDADDVSKLNNAFIEAYHIARAALGVDND